ncbi:MAG: aminotransferase class I/II-fold pyridoxal phosphate-dependent enzyme [Lachnospiraceae bacterium]|nr:aminotransferase class I/II-fold pyridoxal phosphate-dependent enzyme [Lachnospiraceae bacterium]
MKNYRHGGEVKPEGKKGFRVKYDFSINIAPCGPPKKVLSAIQGYTGSGLLEKYPDPLNYDLKKKLASSYGLKAKNLALGSGASELIYRLTKALRSNGRALIVEPSFLEYEKALSEEGYEISRFSCKEEQGFKIDKALIDIIRTAPPYDLIFIANPSNPAGILTKKSLIKELLKAAEEKGSYVILDESFMELTGKEKSYSLSKDLKEYPSLILLNTFTKYYAMPDMRIGYALSSDPETINLIESLGQPWKVSGLAALSAMKALDSKGSRRGRKIKRSLKSGRDYLKKSLEKMGYKVYKGRAAYLLFWSERKDLKEKLLKKGILIRDCSNYYGLTKGYYRIAVKRKKENKILIKNLEEL